MVKRHLEHDWFSRPLPENITLGERTWLYSSFAFIHYQSEAKRGLSVGHDTGLYHGTFFDLGPEGEVQIGDYCSLVGAILASNHHIVIGSYSLIAHEVVIADHDCGLFSSPREGKKGLDSSVQDIFIGENVWIGARAIILGGARIGDGAIIGAATLVREDVPAYSICAGNPARIVGETGHYRFEQGNSV